ncbi:MAG: nucleotidyltransferase domain-containing protein [Verrucomicrobiales bacterium]|nr:nucleotidyltransferase domain-containing protein [Verrucomicrobiales bacterium]
MVSRRAIRRFAREVARRFRPQKIILFGSYAYGRPTPDSDVDLLVIMPCRGRTLDVALKIRRAVAADFPLDLLVRTPRELRQRLALGDCFLQEVVQKGKILYEGPHN